MKMLISNDANYCELAIAVRNLGTLVRRYRKEELVYIDTQRHPKLTTDNSCPSQTLFICLTVIVANC